MDAVKSWVMTLCFAAVAAGVAGLIAPAGNLEKAYKFVVSLFFLSCLLVPLFSMKNISLSSFIPDEASYSDSAENSGMSNLVEEQEIKQAKIKISDLVCSCCKEYGVSPTYVFVDVRVDSSGKVSVPGCRVVVQKDEIAKKKTLEKAVKAQLGIEATFEKEEEKK